MLHAVTMTLVGLKVALLDDWSLRNMWGGHDELASAFLALELAYLLQVRAGPDHQVTEAALCRDQLCALRNPHLIMQNQPMKVGAEAGSHPLAVHVGEEFVGWKAGKPFSSVQMGTGWCVESTD